MSGSLLAIFLFLYWPTVTRPARRRRGRGRRSWIRREGMWGTWSTNGAVEPHGDEAPAGGEAEGSLATHGPDRDELGHGGHKKL